MQSIEHTLRGLDRAAEGERQHLQGLQKTLGDYQTHAKRPFEHEARLKELLARQAQLNAALDLDKSDAQAAEATTQPDVETVPGTLPHPVSYARNAATLPGSPDPLIPPKGEGDAGPARRGCKFWFAVF